MMGNPSILSRSVGEVVPTLHLQPPKDRIDRNIAVGFIDGFCQRERHWADLQTVLGVAAVGDAVFAEEAVKAVFGCDRAGRVHVNEAGPCAGPSASAKV